MRLVPKAKPKHSLRKPLSPLVSLNEPNTHNHSSSPTSPKSRIIKDFICALIEFSLSKLSKPYIEVILQTKEISAQGFREFIQSRKNNMNRVSDLKDMLQVSEADNNSQIISKRVFQELSVIFIKCFSVSWIFVARL